MICLIKLVHCIKSLTMLPQEIHRFRNVGLNSEISAAPKIEYKNNAYRHQVPALKC